MRLSVLFAAIVLSSGSVFAAAPVCPDRPFDGIVPQGVRTLQASSDCSQILALGPVFSANFEYQKIKDIDCGSDKYVMIRVFTPGYQQPEEIDLVNASDLIPN